MAFVSFFTDAQQMEESYTLHISAAVMRLHQSFNLPLRIENLARELGMSVSSLQHQFKAVTEIGPLQYQKRL